MESAPKPAANAEAPLPHVVPGAAISTDAVVRATPAPRRALRRWSVRLVKLAGLFVGLALAAWFFATEPLDTSPILGTAVADRTFAALGDARVALSAAQIAPLRIGYGTAAISPPLRTPTFGYGARFAKGTTEIADSIRANAIAIEGAGGVAHVILSADICLWTSELSAKVAERVAAIVSRERLFFGATHTHNGPGAISEGPLLELFFGAYDAVIVERIVAGCAQAVFSALADLAPASYRSLALDAPDLVFNRSESGDEVDPRVVILDFERDRGERYALVVFSAHATAISISHLASSGDYPGALVRGLEAHGYDGAVFLAGSGSQAGPAWKGESVYEASTEGAYRVGGELARRIVALRDASLEPQRREAIVRSLSSAVHLPAFRYRVGGRSLRPGVAAWLIAQEAPKAHVHALQLDETILVGHSFEFSSVLSRELRARFAKRGLAVTITGFNGDHGFYVVPERDYAGGRYDAGMSCFGPGLAPYLTEITERVVEALAPAE